MFFPQKRIQSTLKLLILVNAHSRINQKPTHSPKILEVLQSRSTFAVMHSVLKNNKESNQWEERRRISLYTWTLYKTFIFSYYQQVKFAPTSLNAILTKVAEDHDYLLNVSSKALSHIPEVTIVTVVKFCICFTHSSTRQSILLGKMN